MKPTILIADDDDAIRLLLTTLLHEEGYDVVVAFNGRQAVELTLAHRPDVVILDVLMPEMSGFEACRAIKDHSDIAHIPVLLLTAIAQTREKVRGLDDGAADYITKPFEAPELLARVRRALQQKTQQDSLAAEALTDVLTGLTNRRGLERQLDQLLAHGGRMEEPLSILIFDVDHFKSVNDAHSHVIGDVVLRALAQRASEAVRSQDVIGRFGGEEFMVILPAAGREAALAAAERLRLKVGAEPIITTAGPIAVTISIGAATTQPGPEISRQTLIASADHALYAAKHSGRNRVVHADRYPTLSAATQSEPPEVARGLIELLDISNTILATHSRTVAQLCWQVSGAFNCTPSERSRVMLAGLLHTIGLLAAPQLTEDGLEPPTVQDHMPATLQLLERLPSLRAVAPIIAASREHWDGSGIPQHLQRYDIPLASRILAVVDEYEHLRYDHREHANGGIASQLRQEAGHRFDPEVVEAALLVLA